MGYLLAAGYYPRGGQHLLNETFKRIVADKSKEGPEIVFVEGKKDWFCEHGEGIKLEWNRDPCHSNSWASYLNEEDWQEEAERRIFLEQEFTEGVWLQVGQEQLRWDCIQEIWFQSNSNKANAWSWRQDLRHLLWDLHDLWVWSWTPLGDGSTLKGHRAWL